MTVHVFAPATVANVACGFDIFGFALETPGDEIIAHLQEEQGVTLHNIVEGKTSLPIDPSKNTAGISVQSFLNHIRSTQGVALTLHKKMPIGSGLGSSAASAAAAVFAVNHLFGTPLSTKELIPFAMEAEKAACGTAHADNVAPALLGGFVLIRSYHPLDIIQIPLSLSLYCAVLHPKIMIQTSMARKLLQKQVALSALVQQSGNAAGLIAGLLQGDHALISRCLEDVIAEPVRSALIPHFALVKTKALQTGALGCSISGSGPAIFALTTSHTLAHQVGKAMHDVYMEHHLDAELFISKINTQGPSIL